MAWYHLGNLLKGNYANFGLMLKATAKLFKHPKANTCYLVLPASLVTDSQFPFAKDEKVSISIEGSRLIIAKVGA
jgi:hypothetical protein